MKLVSKKKSTNSFIKEIIHNKILNYLSKNALITPNKKNMGIFSKDFISHQVMLNGFYELEILELLIEFFKTNNIEINKMNLLDIGSNIGNHAVYFSTFFKHIYCFEPNTIAFKMLELNTLEFPNITTHNFGISNVETETILTYNEDNIGEGRIVFNNDYKENIIPVTLKTLDQLNFEQPIDVIKLDTEGHEFEALSGGIKLIKKYHPYILFEQNKNEIKNGSTKTIDFLKSLNYSKFYTIDRKEYSTTSKINLLSKLFLGSKHEIKLMDKLQEKDYPMILSF